MKKKLLLLGSITLCFLAKGQGVLTTVADNASFNVLDGALVYSGGGWEVQNTGVVNNMGDIMLEGDSTDDIFKTANGNSFILQLDDSSVDKSVYGQLYITGITQGSLSGAVVHKEYIADSNHGTTGSQQLAMPFYQLSVQNLTNILTYLQINSSSTSGSGGRYNPASLFRWNNTLARFDQITVANGSSAIGKPTDYYIIPRRNTSGVQVWNASTEKKSFIGQPVADVSTNTTITMSVANAVDFKSGNGKNYYGEIYKTYVDDPFEATKWASATYAKNLHQFGNPFFTNMDLSNITSTDRINDDDDGIGLANLQGIAYYGPGSVQWDATTGTSYTDSNIVIAKVEGNTFQAGALDKLVIKPMQEVMIKFNSDPSATTFNLNNTRLFSQTVRTDDTYTVTASKNTSSTIPSDKVVKQVGVIVKDAAGNEIGRTYYAVSPSAVTGYSVDAKLQGYADGASVYTKEEDAINGGEDLTKSTLLYINEANELNYAKKEVPFYITNNNAASVEFVVYEKGKLLKNSDILSSGKSFYIKKDNEITKINPNATMAITKGKYGLFYDTPEATLTATDLSGFTQTVITKKDRDWVIIFAPNWVSAKVEVYSAAGQLLFTKNNVSTKSMFTVPLQDKVEGMFIIKTTSDKGEISIKKILK